MARSTMIKVMQCPNCGHQDTNRYCYNQQCRNERGGSLRKEQVERPKEQRIGNYKVVDWFSTRASAGLRLEDDRGRRYEVYMSDLFKFLEGHVFEGLVLEEVKKGSAYGWVPID